MTIEDNSSDTTPESADAQAAHVADRPPTPDEERRAEKAASDADPDVGEHYKEMAELGAEVKGEGQIVPSD